MRRPYLARELGLDRRETAQPSGIDYDDTTCAAFVRELGTGVLNRAIDFFTKLDQDGQVGSVELAQHLNLGTPRNISSALTNSLKQRARALGLDNPGRTASAPRGRTVWINRDGTAARMIVAIQVEQQRRFSP